MSPSECAVFKCMTEGLHGLDAVDYCNNLGDTPGLVTIAEVQAPSQVGMMIQAEGGGKSPAAEEQKMESARANAKKIDHANKLRVMKQSFGDKKANEATKDMYRALRRKVRQIRRLR